MKRLTVLLVIIFAEATSAGVFDSQHEVAALTSVLKQPIPAEWVDKARALDDQFMLDGEIDGQKVYLVTDGRVTMLEEIVERLLINMGEDPRRWVVRVFDTKPKVVNAFVTGGQYIYVFTGLLEEAESQDEIAFVLGHELGHSLLQHHERRTNDWTQQLAALATIAAAINGSDSLEDLSTVLQSDYSQIDEQEADAIGVAIAMRAGYNALRGADFFVRQVRQQVADEKELKQYGDELDALKVELEQQKVNCEYLIANWNAISHTQENVDIYNQECGTYEAKRQTYNQSLAQWNVLNAQRNIDQLTSSHPDSQSRVAAVAALADFMRGRRALDTLEVHQQAYRVMTALTTVNSVLVVSAGDAPPIDSVKAIPREQASTLLQPDQP